jgi:hypothetical protein
MDMGRKAIPFWDHVEKSDGCWIWTGSRRAFGYGRTIVNGRPIAAHRAAWEQTHGPIPDGLLLLHTCDNPPCVRPDHMALGTQIDNLRDMTAKGRRAVGDRHPSHLNPALRQGERHGGHLLSESDVITIRNSTIRGFRRGDLTKLAKTHGVTVSAIWDVVHGKSWRHLLPR